MTAAVSAARPVSTPDPAAAPSPESGLRIPAHGTECPRCGQPVEVMLIDVPLYRHDDVSLHIRRGNRMEPCNCVTKIERQDIAPDGVLRRTAA